MPTSDSHDGLLQAAPKIQPPAAEPESTPASAPPTAPQDAAAAEAASPAHLVGHGEPTRSSAFKPGEIVGGSYEIIEPLGRGAMGMVYRAKHVSMPAEYALKILTDDKLNDLSVMRFQNEAQAIAKLNHPNIVAIYNFGLHQGCLPFYVMDLLEGEDLLDKLDFGGPLPWQEALPLFIEACAGLSYAHKKGILHRDIKPANLLILNKPDVRGARVKVVDFGVVKFAEELKPEIQKLTAMGMVCGTPSYMSPEQATGQKIDPRSDVYSLGCALFETLTGRVPYRGRNASETMMMHYAANVPTLEGKSDGLTFPEDLEVLAAKMLAKAPMDRYQTMEAVAQDLKNILDGFPLGTPQLSQSSVGTNTGSVDSLATINNRREKSKASASQNKLPHNIQAPSAALGAASAAHEEATTAGHPDTGITGGAERAVRNEKNLRRADSETQETTVEPIVGGSPGRLLLIPLLSVSAIGALTYFAWQSLQGPKSSSTPAAAVSTAASTTAEPTAEQAPGHAMALDELEEQSADPTAAPIILPDTRYFSRTVTEQGKTFTEFNFPPPSGGPFLAWIGTSVTDSRRTIGTIRFPSKSFLYLAPMPVSLRAAGFFEKFRPGEIKGLALMPLNCSDQLFIEASKLTGIQQLLLGHCSQLTAKIIPSLSKMNKLTMFNAMGLTIDGSELAKAPFWKELKMLSLSHCHNVHPVLEKLAGSPALEVLDVSTTDLKASDYALIGQMTNLTSLNLTRNKITAADLRALSKLQRLRHLAVVYSRMDGAEFVDAAKRLPSLSLITVLKGQIKDKDLSALRAAKPGLRILQMTSEQFQELTNQAAGKW